MSLNDSLNKVEDEARIDNCEGLSPSRCPAVKQRGLVRHQNTARKRWIKKKTKLQYLAT